MVKTPNLPSTSGMTKQPNATKSSTKLPQKKQKIVRTKKNLSQEISAEATKDVEMMDVTEDTENHQNQSNTSANHTATGLKDPAQDSQTNPDSQADDTSQLSQKSDETDRMTNKDTTTTTSNNRVHALDPNAHAFTPASQTETNQTSVMMDKNNKDKSSNQIIKRINEGIYSLKLPTNDNKNAAAEMQRALIEWYKELKEVGPSIVIYDWKNDTKTRAITKTTEITAKVAPMKHFFFQIRPRSTKGFMWCSVHLGCDGPESELDEGMEWWYKEKKGGFYKRALQYKDSIQIAWLLYSHEKVNRDLLTEKLVEKYKQMWKNEIPLALSWARIKDGTFNAP